MSAPHGPQSANRGGGRGKLRGGLLSRSGATTPRGGSQARKSRSAPRENGIRNNAWRNDPKSTISKHLNGIKNPSPLSRVTTNSPEKQSWRDPTTNENGEYKERMHELWTTLKKNRETERKDAIRKGFLADPDKPTLLANAITPVGTCPDMCPEFERVERIVQQMVDGCEKTFTQSSDTKLPCEELMVKRFRRSAAGYDEQLPSDIRPPLVLQRTLNYLFNEVVGGSQPLATVHKFVWDRTRGIRNDFSIQQVTKTEDLRVAVDCFERIARFHILSLHQLSHPSRDNGEFDHHQEREQLNNTLLSLMYYYDDSRRKLNFPNEAEFRAYCIIFEIQDQRPDLEDRAQNWPKPLLNDPRIQTAMQLYAAAGNTSDDQGPLRPRTHFPIAQGNYGRFWSIIASNRVSYLMACTAEIYFNFVRSMALDSIWKAYKRGGSAKMDDWILGDVMSALGFDTEDQVASFCEDHGFTIGEREDGNSFLDVSSVWGKALTDSNPRRKQVFSKTLVEQKRHGRTLPAIIDGFSVALARANGLIEDSSASSADSPPIATNDESLFLSDGSSDNESARESKSEELKPVTDAPPVNNPFAKAFNTVSASNPFQTFPASNPFQAVPNSNPYQAASTSSTSTTPTSVFPVPSGTSNSSSIFGQPSGSTALFNQIPTPPAAKPAPLFPQTGEGLKFSSATPAATGNDTTKSILFPSTSSSDSNTLPASSGSLPGSTGIFSTSSPNTTPSSASFLGKSIFNFSQPATTTDQSQSPRPVFPHGSLPEGSSIPLKPLPAPLQSPPPTEKSEAPTTFLPAHTLTPIQPSQAPFSFIPQQTNLTGSIIASPNTLSGQPSSVFAGTPSSVDNQSIPPSFSNLPHPSLIQKPATESPPLNNSSSKPHLGGIQDPPKSFTSPSIFVPNRLDASATPHTPHSTVSKTKTGPPKPDLRPQFLDYLADEMICENNGLLQQFLDYTIRPIIVKTVTQVQKERAQEEIDTARRFLLGKKYLRRWKANAWKRGLLRKGKERRKNFAQSMRELSMSRRDSPSSSRRASEVSELDASLIERLTMPTRTMPPPLQPSNSSQKRNSLPNSSQIRQSVEDSKASSIYGNHPQVAPAVSVSGKRPMQPYHRRSRTHGTSALFATSSGIPKARSKPIFNPGPSFNGSASLLSDSVLTQARRLVPPGPADTTRTDYFRLKALGLDPDTPIVPATRKRRISEHTEVEARKRLSPPDGAKSVSQPMRSIGSMSSADSLNERTVTSKGDDEDEELFAQMRQVRSAMAESITFFREEREKSELSRSKSTSRDNTRSKETEKERKLREFQNTPSRTEVRLRATGAHGLLPKNWGQDKGKEKAVEEKPPDVEKVSAPTSRPMGFSALSHGFGGSGFGISHSSNGGGGIGSGASADDAIEL